MRAAFGKVNTLHTHVLPWADRPLVTDEPGRRRGRHRRRRRLGGAADSEPVALPRGDRPGLPRRFGRRVHGGQARRPELRRPPARLSRPHRVDQHRPRRSRMRTATTRSGSPSTTRPGRSRPTLYGVDATVRWRPLQRSIYRSFVGRVGVDLEPPRPAGRAAGGERVLRVGRLSVRAALVRRRRYDRSDARDRRVAATRAVAAC